MTSHSLNQNLSYPIFKSSSINLTFYHMLLSEISNASNLYLFIYEVRELNYLLNFLYHIFKRGILTINLDNEVFPLYIYLQLVHLNLGVIL